MNFIKKNSLLGKKWKNINFCGLLLQKNPSNRSLNMVFNLAIFV